MRSPKAFDVAAYAIWRGYIPFSDEAIASALESEALDLETSGKDYHAGRLRVRAARVRLGHVSRMDLRYALGRLVTLCGVCGKTALYRYGSQGRCRAHRDEQPDWVIAHRLGIQARQANYAQESARIEGEHKRTDRFRQFMLKRRRKART